jgi:zinc transport system substrate-binding protein
MKFSHIPLVLLLAVSLSACQKDAAVDTAAPKNDEFTAVVVNSPLECFAERIAGKHAKVICNCPDDVDPVHWKPNDATIETYQKADVLFANGLGYSGWLEQVTLAKSRVVDTSTAFKDSYIKADTVAHTHGPDGEHSHTDLATHVWLNPKLAILQAQAIRDTLIEKLPDHADEFGKSYDSLETELNSLDDQLQTFVDDELTVLGSHPVYEYLADRCEWKLHAVVWEPDSAPSKAEWKKLAALVKKTNARWMLWEDEPLEETKKQLEDLGLSVIVFKPCGRVASDDFFETMRTNIEALSKISAKSN